MFSPARLPPDSYPDDFDSAAYRTYRPTLRRGVRLWLRERLSCAFFVLLVAASLAGGFVVALLILPPEEERAHIVIIDPSPTPIGDIQGDFPRDVRQISITLPAKIDDVLDFGEKRGYRFFAAPGITWIISVLPMDTLDPVVSLYNPDGTIAQINDNGAGGRGSQLIFEASALAQYAILIDSGQTGGAYTLQILPQR